MATLRGIPAILFVDTLSGILRFLPLTLTVSFIGLGIMLNNLPWLIVGILAVTVWICHFIVSKIYELSTYSGAIQVLGGGPMPAIYNQVCTLIPNTPYLQVPSLWFSLMGYFMVYILMNASNIVSMAGATALGYTKVTVDGNTATGMGTNVMLAGSQVTPSGSIGVSQRKAVGILSMIAVSVLFMIVMIPRVMNQCESTFGILTGLLLGGSIGYGLWSGINGNNPSNPLMDVHGVMLGLSPGYLRHSPIACVAP